MMHGPINIRFVVDVCSVCVFTCNCHVNVDVVKAVNL